MLWAFFSSTDHFIDFVSMRFISMNDSKNEKDFPLLIIKKSLNTEP